MKSFLFFLFSFCLLFVSVFVMAQPEPTLDNVLQEVKTIADVANGQALLFQTLYFSGILGAIVHTWVWTQKGIKTSPTSPFYMAWGLWFRENYAVKIASFATVAYPSKLFAWLLAKLPDGWITYVIIGLTGILAGYFVDFVLSRFKKLIPKPSNA